MVEDNREQLKIPPLKSINEILDKLDFIFYSTQKRNLAHLFQLRRLLISIYDTYKIDRGLAKIFKLNIIRINADIIETLLFCSLIQEGIKLQTGGRKKPGAKNFINTAKTKGIISKRTAKKIGKTIDKRNELHPSLQIEIHSKLSEKDYTNSIDSVRLLLNDIKKYISRQDMVSRMIDYLEETDEDYTYCIYCSSGNVKIGDICPMCGEIRLH